MSIARPCLTDGCSGIALRGGSRCAGCTQRREHARNHTVKRQAYRDPVYRAQPATGICWLCHLPGANTRDHVTPIATQMQRWGEVRDHTTRPAHGACNSGRGAKSS